MSSGLAFGAAGRAGQAIKRAQTGIAIQRSGEEVEEFFGGLGRTTQRAGARGQRQGAFWSILGLAALSAIGGVPISLLLGKGLLATSAVVGVGAGVGARRATEKAAKRAGIETFEPRFHRRRTRRGIEDIQQFLKESAVSRGVEAGALTFGLGRLGGAENFLDFVMQMAGRGAPEGELIPGRFPNLNLGLP